MVKVLPNYLYNDIRKIPEFINNLDSSSESAGKKCIVKMKEIMEQEQKVAMKEVNCYEVFKKNQVTSAVQMLHSLLQVHQERMENLFQNPVKMVMIVRNRRLVTRNGVD